MGELFALINAAGWSVSMVFARRAQQRAQVGILGGLYCSLMVNTVINAIMLLVTLQLKQSPPLTGKGVLFFVLAGICNSLIGRGLLFTSVSILGAARAGVVKATTPVFALMEGVFLLHEAITPLNGVAILVVLGGVLLIAFVYGIVNLIVDIFYAFIDPRVRSQYVSAKRVKKGAET